MRLICGLVRLDDAEATPSELRSMFAALTPPGFFPLTHSRLEGCSALGVLDFSAPAANPQDNHAGGPLVNPDGGLLVSPAGGLLVNPAGGLVVNPDGSWLAADARLDCATGENEAPTISAAFSRWGPDLPGYLDGDFALAFWQPRDRELTLARDFMGVRPLCYFHQPGHILAFASLPKGLHASGIAPRRLDLLQLGLAQLRLSIWRGHTGFIGIEWLQGGHSLVATPTESGFTAAGGRILSWLDHGKEHRPMLPRNCAR